jgi:hypothetical protein
VDAQVRCPYCSELNTPAQSGAPFFCKQCKAIVDPIQAIARSAAPPSGGAPPPPSSAASTPPPSYDTPPSHPEAAAYGTASARAGAASAATPSQYVSRYGAPAPREIARVGGGGLAVAGSLWVGMVLAAVTGGIAALALGWIGESVFRLPLVFPFVVGWLIKRALALGAGGGTPDRGFVGGVALLLVALGAFVAMRWVEYRTIAGRGSERYAEAFGASAARALASPADALATLRARDKDGDGAISRSEAEASMPSRFPTARRAPSRPSATG